MTNHYATIFLDLDGQVNFDISPSLMGCQKDIFTPDVEKRFVQSVLLRNGSSTQSSQAQLDGYYNTLQAPWRAQPAHTAAIGWNERPEQQGSYIEPTPVSPPRDSSVVQTHCIRVGDYGTLRQFYWKAFKTLQQTNCRLLAKAYVKGLEPKKQVNYPYNGCKIVSGKRQNLGPEFTKPPWWPEGIQHREPDHLQKDERLALLVHLLCDLTWSHGVTGAKLREWSEGVHRQIEPASKLEILNEIYSVREIQEGYLSRQIDGKVIVEIRHTDISKLRND